MKFTRLRISGFKTFVEPTEFMIEPGLTGVVGPNGCGKSNLVEALRWVMGENSYRNMRAAGMDEVIFSGSGRRPPRNTAEVTLSLDNSERGAPAHFNDADVLEVTRRIEREAGSVYRVNARDVRARDVQLLFADASTGARSPAMVRQGEIGELISAKPAARRMVLEEAAGISGLHSRRNEAEQRLSAAETNLLRLDDVLREIEARVDALARQSRLAERYRALSGQIRTAEAVLALLEWRAGLSHVAEAESAFHHATSELAERQVRQARTASEQAVAAAALPKLREEAAARGAAAQRLRLAATELDNEEARIRARVSEIARREADTRRDIEREEALVADNDRHLAGLLTERAELDAEREADGERRRVAGERLVEAEGRVAEGERGLEALTHEEARLAARRSELTRAVGEAQTRAQKLALDHQRATDELAAIEARLAAASDLDLARERLARAEAAAGEAESRALQAEEARVAARGAEQVARLPLGAAERRLSELDAEAATLARLLRLDTGSLFPPLIDTLQVTAGYEAALAAAFGEDLEAPADETASAHWSGFARPIGDPELPGGVALARHVRGPGVLSRRLAQIGVVSPADGARLAPLLKTGQCLVTIAGDLWRWDGFVMASGALTPAAQRLKSRNRLTELDGMRAGVRGEVAEARTVLDAAERAMRAAEEAEKAARESGRLAQRDFTLARDALAMAERSLGEIAARRRSIGDNLDRLAEAQGEAAAVLAAAEEALGGVADGSGLRREIEAARQSLGTDRVRMAEARAVTEGLAREGLARLKRLEAIERERTGWSARVAGAADQLRRLGERLAELDEESARLAARPDEIADQRRRLAGERATADALTAAAGDALARAEARSREADQAARAALEALSELREGRVRAEERLAAARQRLSEIADLIDERFECAPSALPSMIQLAPDRPLPNLDDIETRLHRLRAERERMGGVNLSAERELAEAQERREALARERDDLTEAIRRLRLGIQGLNREARERLLAAFEVVDGHFRTLFSQLFGGGTAELKLVDSDDPLDAGLEILARPPGKKPQTLTLLSGGEQALTCLALIFAVFLTNPAPICVLDEVDAPLDDANVERYCDLLDAMVQSTETRFVVITHNPITMARMSRLFGVTMAERGVSQLVSVDLDEAARMVEAA